MAWIRCRLFSSRNIWSKSQRSVSDWTRSWYSEHRHFDIFVAFVITATTSRSNNCCACFRGDYDADSSTLLLRRTKVIPVVSFEAFCCVEENNFFLKFISLFKSKAKNRQSETLISEGDVNGIIESGKDSAVVNDDQSNRYDADSNKDR